MPDTEAEKLSLEPDSVSFMETLIARERAPVGLQNGFSSTSTDQDCSDALGGGGRVVIKTGEEDKEKSSTPPEPICPVGLHKAVLLYPSSAQSLRQNIKCNLLCGWWFEFRHAYEI